MTFKYQIKRLVRKSEAIDLIKENKILIVSDCHRGIGDSADDFTHNYNTFLSVIKEYANNNFLIIELGDGDELWENNKFENILKKYKEIFDIYENLSKKKKFIMIWGNHNREWEKPKKIIKTLSLHLKKKISIISKEALKLKYFDKQIFILHGHQGELINDRFRWIGKFFVRFIWRPIQIKFGFPDFTSTAKNYKARIRVEKRFTNWAKINNIPVIIGHTHRPSFPDNNESKYFNSGSCIHPKGISAIEIQNEKISLIVWHNSKTRKGNIIKKIIGGPKDISEI